MELELYVCGHYVSLTYYDRLHGNDVEIVIKKDNTAYMVVGYKGIKQELVETDLYSVLKMLKEKGPSAIWELQKDTE